MGHAVVLFNDAEFEFRSSLRALLPHRLHGHGDLLSLQCGTFQEVVFDARSDVSGAVWSYVQWFESHLPSNVLAAETSLLS